MTVYCIVKHNHNGRILQKVVHDYNVDDAIALLKGGVSNSESFGEIHYYNNTDIEKWNNSLIIDKVYGLRTFWALQKDDIECTPTWQDNMLKVELAVCEMVDFINISFFNHLLIRKVK